MGVNYMYVSSINSFRPHNISQNQNSRKSNIQDLNNSSKANLHVISFGDRYVHQIAEFTPECTGNGLPEMSLGGEGVVGFELGESLNKHELIKGQHVDDRRFMPMWNYQNPRGGHKFLIHRGVKTENLPDTMPANMFVSGRVGQTKEDMARALHLSPDEIDYVIQSKPNGYGPHAKSKYNILVPTSIKGTVKCPSTIHVGEMEEVPYQLMQMSEHQPSYVKFANRSHNYFIYTPELARTAKPYSYDCFGSTPFEAEIVSSNGMRAWAEILESRMDTDEFGHFKPASVVCHDRPASSFMVHIANMSAQGHKEVNGIIAHKVEHNPSRDYQGLTDDPFKMMSVVGTEQDMEVLRNHPEFPIVKKAFYNGGLNSSALTEDERLIARSVIEPFVAPFRDYFGTYNITKMPIVGVRTNPQNMSLGTVSWGFDREMRSMETPDAARGLTGDYASIQTKPVANGVTIANLRFDERDVQFGRGDNGLSLPENLKNFTPFKYDGTNIEEVIAAKEKNGRWLTQLMWDAGQKGQEELNKLFFNKSQISEGHEVMGYLSPLKEGEMIILGLGRADTQKGYPISTGAALHFFKRDDVPKELKLKTKFLFGIGLMDEKHPHFQMLKKDLEEIYELDGGIYKHNICVSRGFTPNRFNACAQWGGYTSMYEMFGITPVEGKASGSPSSVTATGGFLDTVKDGVTGFTTKDPVMGAPEKYGLTYESSAEELERARINHQIPQVSDNYKRMIELYTNDRQGYIEMCRRNIEEKVDWHDNNAYNRGMSANRRYVDEIFISEQGWGARFKGQMKRLVGEFGLLPEKLETMTGQTKLASARIALYAAIGVFAVGSAIYMLVANRKHNNEEEIPQENNVDYAA